MLALMVIGLLDVLFWHDVRDLVFIALPLAIVGAVIQLRKKQSDQVSFKRIKNSDLLLILTKRRQPSKRDVTQWSLVVLLGYFVIGTPAAVVVGLGFRVGILQICELDGLFVLFWSSLAIGRFAKDYAKYKKAD
jgi:hypothetical protein